MMARSRRARVWRRWWGRGGVAAVAAGVGLALVASLVTARPAFAAPALHPVNDPATRSVPVGKAKPRAAKTSPSDRSITAVDRKTFPAGGAATVAVSGSPVSVGGLPVTLSAVVDSGPDALVPGRAVGAASPAGAGSVRVRVLDPAAARAVGVPGVLVELSRADGARGAGRARLSVDYWAFANAFGGDYGGRLRLVELPACAVRTPDRRECQAQTRLASVNRAGSVSADVLVAGDPAAGADSSTVLAITTDTSSAGQDWSATSLSGTYSWSAGNQGGDFGYRYPLAVPPSVGGPAPELALEYSSGGVDGRTQAENGQTSWVGEGWDLQVGFIERAYRPCVDDGGTTGDSCWFSPYNATLAWRGRSTALVRDDATGVWHTGADDGLKIERFNDTSLGNGDNDGEYWKITTQEVTAYYFGRNKRYTADTASTGSVQTQPVYGNNSGEPCYSTSGFAASWCQQAYRWNLDYVVDARGNSMTYFYQRRTGHVGLNGNTNVQTYTVNARLDHIDYGTRAGSEASGSAPMQVAFGVTERCINACTTADYPDTPWDLDCTSSTSCPNNTSASFWLTHKLSTVTTKVWNSATSSYRNVDRWDLSYTYPPSGDNIDPPGNDTNPNLWLQNIQHFGYAGDGVTTASEPAMAFGGVAMYNRKDWGNDIGVAPYSHYRMTVIVNGVGGQTLVAYSPTECTRALVPTVDNNPYRCFPQYTKPILAPPGWDWFHKYVVTSVTEQDLTGGSPDEVWSYSYSTVGSNTGALWHHDENETASMNYRSWSQWRGYSTVTVTHGPAGGPQTQTVGRYYRGMNGDRYNGSWGGRLGQIVDSQIPLMTDAEGLQGFLREQTTMDGSTVASSTIHVPMITQTASRAAPNQYTRNVPAYQVREVRSRTRTWIAATGTWRWTDDDSTYDSYGVLRDGQDRGDVATTADDVCSHTDFARDTAGSAYLVNLPSQAVGTDCAVAAGDTSAVGWGPATAVATGDVTGDGKPDLVRRDPDGGLYMYANTGASGVNTFAATGSLVGYTWDTMAIITVADYNGDGKADVIASDRGGTLWYYANIGGTGTSTFTTNGTQVGVGWSGMNVIVGADFNADGKADILARSTSGFLYYYANIGGTGMSMFTSAGTQVGSSFDQMSTVAAADMSGDGKADLLCRTNTGSLCQYTNLGGTGMSMFTSSGSSMGTGFGSLDWLVFAKYTADTKPDIIARDPGGDMRLFTNTSTGGVGLFSYTAPAPTYLSGGQSLYDNTTTVGAAPTQGLVTKTLALAAVSPSMTWQQVNRAGYDSYGRPTSSYDALDHQSTTSYTPSTGGPVTQSTLTNPAGWTTTTTVEPGRGKPTSIVDANGKTTSAEYDPLGRLSKVWLANRSTADVPDLAYTYTLQNSAPNWVSTAKLGPNGNQITSYQVYDGRLRSRQTQSPAPPGATTTGGRVITDTAYDGRGLAVKTSMFYNSSAPDASLVTFSDVNVVNQHRYTFDNLQRRTVDALYSGDGSTSTLRYQTAWAYDGDRTTVTPPDGGIFARSYTDARGRTVLLTQYLTSSPAGAQQDTSYSYDRLGRPTGMTDPAGNGWTTTYDLRGRATASSDPDKGSSTSSYDDAGKLLSTTDSRGTTLSFVYDNLDRKTAEWQGAVGTGTLLADWTYDPVYGANTVRGVLGSTRRYTGGNTYTTAVTGYDDGYRPLGTTVTLPAAEGTLAGSWATSTTYNVDGSPATTAYPAAGGLSAETVAYGYDSATGLPLTLKRSDNSVEYVHDSLYYYWGAPRQLLLGSSPSQVRYITGFAEADQRLSFTQTSTQADPTPTWADRLIENYGYSPGGTVTSITEVTGAGATVSNQCFSYDKLQQLQEAWTTTADTCQSTPSQAVVGGPDPYWTSYSYDNVSNRTGEVRHASTGDTTRTYAYPAAGHAQPHTLQTVTITGASTGTDSFGYDAAGNTTTRSLAGRPSQAMTWDAEGHLATVVDTGGTTGYVYDSSGNRLLAKDPDGGATLYLPGTEIHRDNLGALTATRYYSHAGKAVASRTASALTWLTPDRLGTAQLAIDAGTLAVTRRKQDPYGNPRGTVPSWPNPHGYVGGVSDATGLTHLGAREYDPTIGRFVSVDPVLDKADPQQANGYAYADNNPTTSSDPSGLCIGGRDYGDICPNQKLDRQYQAGEVKPAKSDPPKPPSLADEARHRAEEAKQKLINAVLGIVKIAMDVLGITAAVDCVTTGDLGACVETVVNIALTLVGELLPKIVGKYLARIGEAVRITKRLKGLFHDLTDSFNAWRKESKLAKAAETAGGSCLNSFAPDTPVRMADGTTKPIKDVKVGEKVLATDPRTGRTEAKSVVALHVNQDRDLADVTVVDLKSGTTSVLHTTWHHPFWNPERQQWIDAVDLRLGDGLMSLNDPIKQRVLMVRTVTGSRWMRNLTVADIHTYYVVAGTTPTLVHNCPGAIVDPGKWDYIFGNVASSLHNAARSMQNAAQFARMGVYNNPEGRALLQSHFDELVRSDSNIVSTFSNEYGEFQVRDSLFAGPGGFLRLETTWEVTSDGLRLTTVIPRGGP